MHIEEHAPLASCTTFRIGGPARYLIDVAHLDALGAAFAFAQEKHLPVFLLGAGSNLLVSDSGFAGVVIHISAENVAHEDEGDDVLVIAEAGKSWDVLVEESVSSGWWGMENLSGIPSSVGASVVQNIGAYGAEVSAIVEWVEVYDPHRAEVFRLDREACRFGYRDSLFKQEEGNTLVVRTVAYRLHRRGTPQVAYQDLERYRNEVHPITTLRDVRTAVLAVRQGKFPPHHVAGTAGSFFQNPIISSVIASQLLARFPEAPHFPQRDGREKLSAAWIIDHVLHARGLRDGDVGTWPTQALIVVNYGTARAEDVQRFTTQLRTQSMNAIGVDLVPEVVMVGEMQKNF